MFSVHILQHYKWIHERPYHDLNWGEKYEDTFDYRSYTHNSSVYHLLNACWIMSMKHHLQIWKFGTPRMGRKAVNFGEVWNLVCCHGEKTVKLKLWSILGRIVLQRIKHFWFKLAEISFYIIFDQHLVECMKSSLG